MQLQEAWNWLTEFAQTVQEQADFLTDLDRQIGDADHGSNLKRGLEAVMALNLADYSDATSLLKKAGMTLVSTVGGASGPLYGTFFLRFAGGLSGVDDPTVAFETALAAGVDGVSARGKSTTGEKTMLDTLVPALTAYRETPGNRSQKLLAAREAAEKGMHNTIDLIATKGRASYLGERSKGVQDPGATSAFFLVSAAATALG